MNKYWWVKIEQVNFRFEKNSQIWKLKVQLILLNAIMHLLDSDTLELFSHFFIFLL